MRRRGKRGRGATEQEKQGGKRGARLTRGDAEREVVLGGWVTAPVAPRCPTPSAAAAGAAAAPARPTSRIRESTSETTRSHISAAASDRARRSRGQGPGALTWLRGRRPRRPPASAPATDRPFRSAPASPRRVHASTARRRTPSCSRKVFSHVAYRAGDLVFDFGLGFLCLISGVSVSWSRGWVLGFDSGWGWGVTSRRLRAPQASSGVISSLPSGAEPEQS